MNGPVITAVHVMAEPLKLSSSNRWASIFSSKIFNSGALTWNVSLLKRRDDVLDSTLHRCLNDINLEACGSRVEGFDYGISACERGCERRYVLEVSGLDRDGRGKLGVGVLPDVASADGHGKRGGDEGVDDGTADVTGCLRGMCQAYTVFSIGARGSLGKSTYAQDKHKGPSWEHNVIPLIKVSIRLCAGFGTKYRSSISDEFD